jgi:hypothetical protein
VEIVPHVSDDTLERFAMESLRGSESEPLEEHLLICPGCRERLKATDEFVTAMTSAAAKMQKGQRRKAKAILPSSAPAKSTAESNVAERNGHESE